MLAVGAARQLRTMPYRTAAARTPLTCPTPAAIPPAALTTFVITAAARSSMALLHGFAAHVLLVAVSEAAQSPFSIMTDAAIAASTDQAGYGRKRVLASLGWGGERGGDLWNQACVPAPPRVNARLRVWGRGGAGGLRRMRTRWGHGAMVAAPPRPMRSPGAAVRLDCGAVWRAALHRSLLCPRRLCASAHRAAAAARCGRWGRRCGQPGTAGGSKLLPATAAPAPPSPAELGRKRSLGQEVAAPPSSAARKKGAGELACTSANALLLPQDAMHSDHATVELDSRQHNGHAAELAIELLGASRPPAAAMAADADAMLVERLVSKLSQASQATAGAVAAQQVGAHSHWEEKWRGPGSGCFVCPATR